LLFAALWACVLVVTIYCMVNRAPFPGGVAFFAISFPTILFMVWMSFVLEMRTFDYTILGTKRPRATPKMAWHGEAIDGFCKVGKLRGAARWVISQHGVLATLLPMPLTMFVPWNEVLSLRRDSASGTWLLYHQASDLKSPVHCDERIAEAIVRWRGEQVIA
jgi:hypothetical protein